VGELFDGLVALYPSLKGQLITESGDLHKFVNVYCNDDDIRYTGRLDTPVKENDVVSIIPAVAGG
jgi:molybdopterin converting factor small subunit